MLDLTHTLAEKHFLGSQNLKEFFTELSSFIFFLEKSLGKDYIEIFPAVYAHKTAMISKTAELRPPCIIGADTEVRQGAFIRGSVMVGKGCVVGNSSEVKNAVFFDGVQIPHFNYVGDSILGYKAHMGAGAIISNVKGDKTDVQINGKDFVYTTNLKKFGAILGNFVEVGCNSVINPGTVICENTQIYPLSCVRGVIPSNSIYKSKSQIIPKK